MAQAGELSRGGLSPLPPEWWLCPGAVRKTSWRKWAPGIQGLLGLRGDSRGRRSRSVRGFIQRVMHVHRAKQAVELAADLATRRFPVGKVRGVAGDREGPAV